MSDDFFAIPGDILREAEAAAEFKLVVPESATVSKRDPNTHFWNEGGTVTSASSDGYISPETYPVLALSVEVSIDSTGSGVNTGRPVNTTFRISKKALENKAPKNLFTMSLMSINKLKQLMTSIGIEPDMQDGGYSPSILKEYFPKSSESFPSETSQLLGQDLYFQVKQSPYTTKDGDTKIRAEINKFLPRG